MATKPIATCLCLFAVSIASSADDQTDAIRQAARNFVKALLIGDYPTVVDYTPPRFVKEFGGKEAMISEVKSATVETWARGIKPEDTSVGTPEKPRKIGNLLVALVPVRVSKKVEDGHLQKDYSLLAISEDNEKHWVFFDVENNADETFKIFPELAGKFTLPAKKEPVLKKDTQP